METGFCPERLKNIREERGLNKAEAARLLGLSKMGYAFHEFNISISSHCAIQ